MCYHVSLKKKNSNGRDSVMWHDHLIGWSHYPCVIVGGDVEDEEEEEGV